MENNRQSICRIFQRYTACSNYGGSKTANPARPACRNRSRRDNKFPLILLVYTLIRRASRYVQNSETCEKICQSGRNSRCIAVYNNIHNGRVCTRFFDPFNKKNNWFVKTLNVIQKPFLAMFCHYLMY